MLHMLTRNDKVAGVYRIRNVVTGSAYVGSAVNIRRRWAAHRSALASHKKSPPKLQNAWDSYGAKAFVFEVLCVCAPKDTLMYEQRFIDGLQPKYNTRTEAAPNLGVVWSDAVNAKKGRSEKQYTYAGVTAALHTLIKRFAVVTGTCVRHRIHHGWELGAALTTPAMGFRERGTLSRKSAAKRPQGKVHTVQGKTGTLRELVAQETSLSLACVKARLRKGMPLEEALRQPPATSEQRMQGVRMLQGVRHPAAKVSIVQGVTGSMRQLSDHFGVSYAAALKRVGKYGWSLETALTTPVKKRGGV